MKRTDLIAAAWWGVSSRPMRTAALLLSLGAGVAGAVFAGTVVTGFGREIDRLAFGAYARALVIRENVLVIDRHAAPRITDLGSLRTDLPGYSSSAAWKAGRAQTQTDQGSVTFAVYGVLGDYEPELDTPLAEGRMLTGKELAGLDRSCLIGAETALQLKRSPLVGSQIRIEGVDCRIVGVLAEPRSRPAARFAESVIAPFQTAERYFIRDTPLGPGEADSLTVIVEPGTDMKSLEMRTDRLLRKHRGASLSQPSPFSYGLPSATLKQISDQQTMLARLLIAVASLSILTSIIAFGSISAAAVESRRREIALRMALGGSRNDVQIQILTESLLVGLTGGGLGLAAGLIMAWIAGGLWSWPFAPSGVVGCLAVVLGAGVGLLSGAMQARRAASLAPSLAARN